MLVFFPLFTFPGPFVCLVSSLTALSPFASSEFKRCRVAPESAPDPLDDGEGGGDDGLSDSVPDEDEDPVALDVEDATGNGEEVDEDDEDDDDENEPNGQGGGDGAAAADGNDPPVRDNFELPVLFPYCCPLFCRL